MFVHLYTHITYYIKRSYHKKYYWKFASDTECESNRLKNIYKNRFLLRSKWRAAASESSDRRAREEQWRRVAAAEGYQSRPRHNIVNLYLGDLKQRSSLVRFVGRRPPLRCFFHVSECVLQRSYCSAHTESVKKIGKRVKTATTRRRAGQNGTGQKPTWQWTGGTPRRGNR